MRFIVMGMDSSIQWLLKTRLASNGKVDEFDVRQMKKAPSHGFRIALAKSFVGHFTKFFIDFAPVSRPFARIGFA